VPVHPVTRETFELGRPAHAAASTVAWLQRRYGDRFFGDFMMTFPVV
jgi:hypothetical protein